LFIVIINIIADKELVVTIVSGMGVEKVIAFREVAK